VSASPSKPAVPALPRVEELAHATLPTPFGTFQAHVFREREPAAGAAVEEHVALVLGEVRGQAAVPVRVHSECLTGEVFGSLRCDCRAQLEAAQQAIAAQGAGVIVYLRQEGRGIGLTNKIKAYALQEQGLDTVDANRMLHLPIDAREYGVAAAILQHLGVGSVKLMTNNPSKLSGLQTFGISVTERVPLVVPATEHSSHYLQTKRHKLQHDLPSTPVASPTPLKPKS
jgi:GTP cyclohydrolase II